MTLFLFLLVLQIASSKATLMGTSEQSMEQERAEDLIEIKKIPGTSNLFFGVPYRLTFRDLGKAPIIYETKADDRHLLFAERRQTEWDKYKPGTAEAQNAEFMFIPGTAILDFEMVNLGILKKDSTTCMTVLCNSDCGPFSCCASLSRSTCSTSKYWRIAQQTPELIALSFIPRASQILTFGSNPNYQKAIVGAVDVEGGLPPENQWLINIELAGAGLTGKIIWFEFLEDPEEIESSIKEVTMINKNDILNNSTNVITQTIVATKTVSDTFTFGFHESLKVMAKVTVSAGIPLLGKAETETGIEGSFESHQELSSTTTHQFEIRQEIPVAPKTRVHVNGILKMADSVTMPFRAKMEVVLNIDRLTTYGRQVVHRPVPANLVEEYLKANKVEGTILEKKGNTLIMEVEGLVHGTYGINTVLSVTEFPL